MPGGMPGGRPGGGGPVAPMAAMSTDSFKVDYITQAIVVDYRGGERLRDKKAGLNSMGELLLVDPDGNLVVRNEVEDGVEWRRLNSMKPPEGGGRETGRPAAPRGGGGLEGLDGAGARGQRRNTPPKGGR
jgi:hypothetical protein